MNKTHLRPVAALLVAILAVALAPAAPASARGTSDVPWSGYGIASDHTAAGGFIGARRAARRVVYRIDPGRRRTATAGFYPVQVTSRLAGAGPRAVSMRATARAAWIVGKYGSYKYAIQNAAVDLALDQLLYGGRWSLNGSRTNWRLSRTPYGSEIRSFARQMLAASAKYAGPYRVRVTVPGTQIGGLSKITVIVRAFATGAPIADLPVSVSYAGSSPRVLWTGKGGAVSTSFAAITAGPNAVRVRVGRLPDTRLWVRRPRTAGASRVVVANIRTSRSVTVSAAVQAKPTVTVASTRSPMDTAQAAAGRFTVASGYASPRSGAARLYGPFSTSTVSCDPTRVVAIGNATVVANGTFALPATLRVPRYGYYAWGLSVPADAYNQAMTACGAMTLARVTPVVVPARSATTVKVRAATHGIIRTGGLPAGYVGNATFRLYGPFKVATNVGCGSGRLLRSQTVRVSANGSTSGASVKLSGAGYYVWWASVPGSTFSNAKSSACKPAGSVFRVTQ